MPILILMPILNVNVNVNVNVNAFSSLILENSFRALAARVSIRGSSGHGAHGVHDGVSILFSQKQNQNHNQDQNQNGYRSIADVVGGLHGGKYEFGGDAYASPSPSSSSFDGRGGKSRTTGIGRFASLLDDDDDGDDDDINDNEEEIPNWALKMQPPPRIVNADGDDDDINDNEEEIPNWALKMQPPPRIVNAQGEVGVETIHIKSNADPMDGMVHSSTVIIQNEERTWEKFYAKIMVLVCKEDGELITVPRTRTRDYTDNDIDADIDTDMDMMMNMNTCMVDVKPKSGHLAPRGGASNACDANKPYSDSVTLHIFHRPPKPKHSCSPEGEGKGYAILKKMN
eukprot:CAMPEP_0194125514 /NCGR_PEP_ID=MMETSP0150-20130528/59504_1 /TAXON_ID=122233 /ORGANISM="Chaetoceros debilis, Strain MM31A-1" /LENGTH=341 /DNA_ID=CAMNT_0038819325 /DNA_START=108 /DNA_END=1130 /DNA_ORIENTATION=+